MVDKNSLTYVKRSNSIDSILTLQLNTTPFKVFICLVIASLGMLWFSPLAVDAGENPKVTKKLQKVEKYFGKGDTESALSSLEALIKKYPDDPRSYVRLAKYYLEAKLYNDATRYADDASRVDPNNEKVKQIQCDILQGVGRMKVQMRQYPAAEEAYKKMYSLCPSEDNKGRILFLYKKMLAGPLENKDYPAAIDIYHRILEVESNKPEFHFKLFRLYYQNGQKAEGEAVVQKAISLFPNDLNLIKALGSLYFEDQKFEEAKMLFTKARESDPENVFIAQTYAFVLKGIADQQFNQLKADDKLPKPTRSRGKTKSSIAAYKKELEQKKQELIQLKQDLYKESLAALQHAIGLDKKSENPKLMMTQAVIYGFVGLEPEMKQSYLRAASVYDARFQENPEDLDALHYCGFCLLNANTNLEKAEMVLRKMLEMDLEQKHPTSLIYLGEILVELEKPLEAKEFFDKFKEDFSTHPALDRAEQWLDYIDALLSGTPLGQKPTKLQITEPVIDLEMDESEGLVLDDSSGGLTEDIMTEE